MVPKTKQVRARFQRPKKVRNGGAGTARNHNVGIARRQPDDLTPREREVLQLIWAGLTNRALSERLQISAKTGESHRANMMKKLRVSNTAQLLKAALEGKFLRADDGGKGSDGAK